MAAMGTGFGEENDEDNENALAEEVSNLVDRALQRSFDDSDTNNQVFNVDSNEPEMSESAKNATARVNYLMENELKAHQLTSMLLKGSASKNQVVDSPAVCRMIDQFRKQRDNNNK